jgi:glutamyl-tRNA reductase
LGLNGERRLHLKVSAGALHYLARVTLGLESVAEGEHAIGRQVIRAFEVAHDAGKTDKVLHMCWHAMGRILQARRATGVGSSVGVQSLAAAALADVGKHELILVKGQGEIGRQVLMTLKRDGYLAVEGFSRSQSARFFELASSASAIVVCTGGPSAWLSLPQRTDSPVVIDLGVPRQLQATPGWHRIELDELLRRRGLQLGPEALAMLEELADEATTGLREALGGTSHHALLEALELEKRKFFESDVEKVLSELAPREARRVSEALRGFTHRLLEVTRRAGRVS